MTIYSYFNNAWKHLKGIFQQPSVEQSKNLAYELEESKEAYKSKSCKQSQLSSAKGEEEFNSRALRLILKKTKIYSLFEKYVSDPRSRISSIIYSIPSILMHALSLLILRQPSKNALHDAELLSPYLKENLSKLIRAPSTPCPKTVEDVMLKLDVSELESILPLLFRTLLRGKFFELHSEFMPESDQTHHFAIGIDAEITHVYHDLNQHPVSSCSYCLKRTRGETSWYVHCDVSLCIIGRKGFIFPLFLYRVKANHAWEMKGDEEFKQQCELSALPYLLESFRHYFPKLKADLLLDSLYAQGTTMNLCEQFKLGYMIIRKSGSLKSLNSNIEGLKKLQSPQKRQYRDGRWNKEQTAFSFSDLSHREHVFTLIDLEEKCTKLPSKRFAKVREKSSHWQWITNLAVKVDQIFNAIHKGRLRWSQEDFFNSLENRGFNFRHDFSRSPHSQTIWRLLTFIAFALSSLMQLSILGHLSRRGCSIINWIKAIFGELGYLSPDQLWQSPLPKQLRFWNDSS
ncbi:MAG TPA: hypothetical protein VN922_00110 [Bacteroidia bacterium]|nr:hypothetical protein [Bacteroidia bacterium]